MPKHEESVIDITPSPRLLQVLGEIPLQPWQCLAELIDNSLDEIARDPEKFQNEPLCIDITVQDGPGLTKTLVVRDNGLGMSREDFEVALKAGATTKARYGTLGLFGMGFNIATARLGTQTVVRTSRAEDPEILEVTVDFARLQQTESFTVPLSFREKESSEHGTTVKIVLKPNMVEAFSSPGNLQTIRNQLGDVYSFLLRDAVPGLADRYGGMRIPASIRIEGIRVEPKIPCIMSDQRTVTSYGQPVNAVQYIDQVLTEATACLSCGYWDRTNGPTECEECGSRNLQVLERRIWGWLGIQRFLDSSHYGIDFIRFGRKILKQDKDIFKYEDVDTLQVDVEYPIEMPANRGRIVGEIHLDHVPVTYQKNAFDTQHRDWQRAREVIRGTGPLKPQGSRVTNNASKLALLFSAYRRNDPGLKCLIPGDGSRAIHAKAAEWARLFDRGVPLYREDTEWYESARRHDEGGANAGQVRSEPTDAGDASIDDLLPAAPTPPASVGVTEVISLPAPVTRDQVLARIRSTGVHRSDLGVEVTLRHNIGTWIIKVTETTDTLTTPAGVETPVTNSPPAGQTIEVFVNREHLIIREFGTDVREMALLQAAEVIHELSATSMPVAVIYSEVVTQIEDLRVTANALTERAERTIHRTRQLMLRPVAEDPLGFWERLESADKAQIEMAAAASMPNSPFQEVVSSGNYILVATGAAMAKLVAYSPSVFFDGVVFRAALAARSKEARERLANKATRALASLSEFLEDPLLRQADDLQLAHVTLDSLEAQLLSEVIFD